MQERVEGAETTLITLWTECERLITAKVSAQDVESLMPRVQELLAEVDRMYKSVAVHARNAEKTLDSLESKKDMT
jgi:hypothetical protein